MSNFYNQRHIFNYPYEDAFSDWNKNTNENDFLQWHLKYTPWFSKEIILRMVQEELKQRENKNIKIAEDNNNNSN